MEIIVLIIIVLVIGYYIGKSSNKASGYSSPRSPEASIEKKTVETILPAKKEEVLPKEKVIRNQSDVVIEVAKPKAYKDDKTALPQNLELTSEFTSAMEMIDTKGESVFITGKAGTGKSTLLRYLKSKTEKECVVLSPTGIAAINIQGQTIHSFFKFPPTLITEHTNIFDADRVEILSKIDLIIIDEISMVRADLIDAIDRSLRIHRSNELPFGGVQMVFFGDLYQLPPVVADQALRVHFETFYESPYFFSSNVFKKITFQIIELQKVFRQKDPKFINLLNNIRIGKTLPEDLASLNTRVVPNFMPDKSDLFITLATTNAIADNENARRLAELKTTALVYNATITGSFERNAYPTSEPLTLKEGAQVMMIKNDAGRRWANGSIGTITSITQEKIEVEIKGSKYEIQKEKWEVIEYVYNKKEKKIEQVVKGTFEQYPLKLAWAVTIHKSQGQTFDQVVVDLGTGAFAHGQSYVALSRCTSFEGIILKQNIRSYDIILDQRVQQYMARALAL